MEVMWKAVAVILNRRFTASIIYHNSLHRFWSGCGTGTATLEVKMIQNFSALRESVLRAIFLDLNKAYDSLYRYRCLDILEGYDMGPRSLRLLRRYWYQFKMVVRAGGYYLEPFRREIGVTQGDPMSPTIFNVMVDAVVRHWDSLVL